MAIDIQVIAMVSSYVPYERPPQSLTLWSAIPRGLQSFVIDGVALDDKALNDDALLQMTATLPPNFGYVLMDVRCTIAQATAFNWGNIFNLNLQSFFRPGDAGSLSIDWRADFLLSDPLTSTRRTTSWLGDKTLPTFPMIGTPGSSGVLVELSAANPQDQASTGGSVSAYMSWWQFDLEQIRKFPINTPFPVQAR